MVKPEPERMCTEMAVELNSDNFLQVIEEAKKAGKPMLIDFWAPWCGPCRNMASVVERLSEERRDFMVCKVNVDEEEELAMKFEVSNIPYFVVIKDGRVAAARVGGCSKLMLEEFVNNA